MQSPYRRKMTNNEDVKITDGNKGQKGFMVDFEHRTNGMLISGHFPDKHAGEPLIKTEEEAWELV